MARNSIESLNVGRQRVLVRADFNVPLSDGRVADDTRIRAALPTLEWLLARDARVILVSHLGRPKGERKPELSLAPVAARLSELLGFAVPLAPDTIGPDVESAVDALAPGRALLLENVRFHAGETKNDPAVIAGLARLADVYVNDAFGTAHRAHASTEGIAHRVKAKAAGFLMEKELRFLGGLLANPKRPFTVVLGGAKVSDKIGVIQNLLPKCDRFLIGGAMMFTFWRAAGLETGRSLVEEDKLDLARDLADRGTLVVPSDCIAARDIEAGAPGREVAAGRMAADEAGVDIGPATRSAFMGVLESSQTIFWNGPMGIFEKPAYAEGTLVVARAIGEATGRGATTVVGGGDSVAAVRGLGFADSITHVSTGGGASLEFLEGKVLPGVAALETH